MLSLLALETAFRLFWRLPPWFAEFQQAGMYVAASDGAPMLQPGYVGTLAIGADRETAVQINGLGMRGAELAAKPPGAQRLLMLGDSMVFGYGVEHEDALPASLERELRQHGVAIQVGNGGVPGYGSRHYVQHMQRLDTKFAPDAFVICGCMGNDAIDDASPYRTVYAGLMLSGGFAHGVRISSRMRLAFRSRAALWLESWLVNNQPEWSLLAGMVPDADDAAMAAGLPPPNQRGAGLFLDVRDEARTWQVGTPPVVPRLCGYLRESLQRAKQIAGKRPLVYVILPTSMQTDGDRHSAALARMGLAAHEYPAGLAQQRWLQAARDAGVMALDATNVLREAGPAEQIFLADGGHLSVRGNQVVAEWLRQELLTLLR